MPVLSHEQLAQIRQIIQDGATALAISTLGEKVSDVELQRLVDEGYIDPATLQNLVLDAFTYGQLMAKLPFAKTMSYPEFKTYLKKYPMTFSDHEMRAYDAAQQRAGIYCRGLGNRFNEETGRLEIEVDQELAQKLREGIQTEVSESRLLHESRGSLVRRLRQMSGQMTRDWTRIAATESHLAHQEGFYEATVQAKGPEVMLAKIPDEKACDACLAAYRGPDKKPLVMPASWWAKNGTTNAGRKKKEWLPVLGGMHPWCITPGQLITTSHGLVPIECIRTGDIVQTALGRWRPVTQIFRHYHSGPVIEAAFLGDKGKRKITVTPNHTVALVEEPLTWVPAAGLASGMHVRAFASQKHVSPKGLISEVRPQATLYFCLSPLGFPAVGYVAHDAFQWLHGSSLISASPAAEALFHELYSFGKRAQVDPMALLDLDGAFTMHPKLRDYFLYGTITTATSKFEAPLAREDEMTAPGMLLVQSIQSLKYQGYVFNLSVEEDQSYLVHGVAVHNCQCQLVEVPEGFAFNKEDSLEPIEIEKSEFSGSAGAMEYRGLIGTMGHQGNPARTCGENVQEDRCCADWPPELDRPLHPRPDLPSVSDRFSLAKRRRSQHAEAPTADQLQARKEQISENIEASARAGKRYRKELEDRQKERRALRGTLLIGSRYRREKP